MLENSSSPDPNSGKPFSADNCAPQPVMHELKPAPLTKPSGRQCPKCGSAFIIPNRKIHRDGEGIGGVYVYADAAPDALIFKERMKVSLFADICGECGHAELKVENPRSFYNHYSQSKNHP